MIFDCFSPVDKIERGFNQFLFLLNADILEVKQLMGLSFSDNDFYE